MPREFPRFMIIRGKSAENAEGVLTHTVTDKTNGPGLGAFTFSTQEGAATFIRRRHDSDELHVQSFDLETLAALLSVDRRVLCVIVDCSGETDSQVDCFQASAAIERFGNPLQAIAADGPPPELPHRIEFSTVHLS